MLSAPSAMAAAFPRNPQHPAQRPQHVSAGHPARHASQGGGSSCFVQASPTARRPGLSGAAVCVLVSAVPPPWALHVVLVCVALLLSNALLASRRAEESVRPSSSPGYVAFLCRRCVWWW
eukprot:4131953-Pyramimonas_sp.AAC.2